MAKFFTGSKLLSCGDVAARLRRSPMAWNKPKIAEVAVSMEVTMYAPAKRK
jgi:coenzyme PQQ precursor peptide PqqA